MLLYEITLSIANDYAVPISPILKKNAINLLVYHSEFFIFED